MPEYRRNHYVPEWYQRRFLPNNVQEKKFYYLDLTPDSISNGRWRYKRKALLRWGPSRCFCERDLYTTKFGKWKSTEIEEKFFGKIDSAWSQAVEYWSNFKHPSIDQNSFETLLLYMSIQKLRTPKGLDHLAHLVNLSDKNKVLFKLQELQQIFCALWTECIWSIVDASNSDTKFLLSDHPVTVYNRVCFPLSKWCRGYRDPDIWFSGTHTLFPLSLERMLILTNLSWVRNPYKRLMIDIIQREAGECLKACAGINFEIKIVLSIAIRIAAEKFMAGKIKDAKFVDSIESNQTPKLLAKFKELFPDDVDTIETIQRVVLMTPENIHLNSFMYEPILDMSDEHLRNLYKDVLALK